MTIRKVADALGVYPTAITWRIGSKDQLVADASGAAFASIHREQVGLAERICARLVSAELVRFTNSGSEASALAARIAKHLTGRRQIVRAVGGDHGSVPPFLSGEPDVIRIPYNDVLALHSVVTDQTSAIFFEPFLGAGGVIPGSAEFLRAAQETTMTNGVLFVLDEVQSLRNAFGEMQGGLGLSPDLTFLGKIIGGGFPIGAVCGRAAVKESISPYNANRLEQAGTFNGHLATATAGAVSLDHLHSSAIEQLNTNAEELAASFRTGARQSGIAMSVSRPGSKLNVHPKTSKAENANTGVFSAFRKLLLFCLLLEGIYSSTQGMINLSTALVNEDLEAVSLGYRRAFKRLAQHPELFNQAR